VPPPPPRHVVVTDANVLINLMHVQRLALLGALPALTFVVPEPVVAEITDPGQVPQLQEALQRQDLRQEAITALHELTAYAELRRIMGQGEAACLAMAVARGWMVASDERRRFRREVVARLGEGRLVTTAGLFVLAIRAGLLSVEDADQAKAVLEQHRFRMTFASFRELLASPPSSGQP
jgi:predicted nucleic acid-binding protein